MAKQPTPDRPLTVFVPEGFTGFQCARCGDCCTQPPPIRLSAARYPRLARALNQSDFAYPLRDAVMKSDIDPSEPVTFALVGERCAFRTESGTCHLCDIGVPELRGLWCITFPVTPLVTPRGVNYALSFACPQTVALLRPRRPLNILALSMPGPPPPSVVRPLTARHVIPVACGRHGLDWTAHRLIEGLLLAVARDWQINLSDRLTLMPVMLDHLLKDYAGPDSNAALRQRVTQAGQQLSEMVRHARTFRPDPAAHYEALAGVFGRRIGLRTRSRIRTLVEDAMRQVRGRRTKVKMSELGGLLAALYSKHYKPRAARLEHVLGNYAICRLFASPEMLLGGVYKGLYVVCYLVALARFLATTTAAGRGSAVNLNILLDAVRTVEKVFYQPRTVFDFLDADDEQMRMLDPAAAAALVRI